MIFWQSGTGGPPEQIQVAVAGTAVAAESGASPSPGSGQSAQASPGPLASPAVGSAASAQKIVVDVVGPVRRPGIVTLPSGSRVADAIAAAGGLKKNKTRVNLARLLVDGEQVDVADSAVNGSLSQGSSGAGASDSANGGAGRGTPGKPGASVNLNQASETELETLPRVGPVMAQKIIDFRASHGGFTSVDQLREVPGIGEVTFAGLAPLVRV